jgi:hypothetical protein
VISTTERLPLAADQKACQEYGVEVEETYFGTTDGHGEDLWARRPIFPFQERLGRMVVGKPCSR